MTIPRVAVALGLALVVAGCGGPQVTQPDEPAVEPPVQTRPVPPPPPVEPVLTPQQQRELRLQQLIATRTLYFDYDKSDIRPEFLEIIEAHARHLARNPGLQVLLEGHCDERGSREYNIGLGERRAHAVRRALLLQGVGAGQVRTISYGEERPAVPAHNEAAWARNRRVEIVYR